jgi:protease I
MTKKAVIITGNLVQDHEMIYPYYRLLEEGFEVTVALKDGKSCVGILGTKIPSDDRCRIISYEELRGIDANLMVIPGGAKAMEKLRQEPTILEFIKNWDSQEKIIASICHGAQLLISSKVVEGKDISAYYSIKDDVNNAGANYIDAPFVTSRNIISSPHYKYLGDWMKEVLRVFNLYNDKKNIAF